MIYPSTYSIVAYDRSENAWGIAVASKFLAASVVVAWARAGAGAVATQAHANASYGIRGLELMEDGYSAEEVVNVLISNDPDRDVRQVGLVDKNGNAATYTGQSCHEWAGGLTGDGFAIQGNILTDKDVIQMMKKTFVSDHDQPIHWRLYRTLLAGEQAGGDLRGKQSAAILLVKENGGYGGFTDRWIDYRVDDHPHPVIRLGEILELHDLYFQKSPRADQVQLTGAPLRKLQKIMKRLGFYRGDINGRYDAQTRKALESFVGTENFEERAYLDDGRIDRPVYEYLLNHF